jgi:hypothetical protein
VAVHVTGLPAQAATAALLLMMAIPNMAIINIDHHGQYWNCRQFCRPQGRKPSQVYLA